MKPTFHFTKAFFRAPRATGSLVPSSRFLVDRMLRQVNWEQARVVVELGAGIGCITEQILLRLRSDGALIAIDCNPEFTEILRSLCRDSRIRVVLASATRVTDVLGCAGYESADYVFSGLPFATMESEVRQDILRACSRLLRPNGNLILFQYRKCILPLLKEMFSSVETDYEILNFPPAHVFRCAAGRVRLARHGPLHT
jgi:phospholipid N-methyltransferase